MTYEREAARFWLKICLPAMLTIASAFVPSYSQTNADADGCSVTPKITLSKKELNVSEKLIVYFVVLNNGETTCRLPSNLLPEGWLIRISIHDDHGHTIYESPVTKIEMTRAKIGDLIELEPKKSHSVRLELKNLLPGNYKISGILSTTHMAGWKIRNFPLGTWVTPSVDFEVLKN